MAYEESIAWAAKAAGVKPLSGPVELWVSVKHPIPTSWPKKKQAAAIRREVLPGKPDLSNVIKAVEDALNGIAYADDRQVVVLRANKRYDQSPGLEVTVGYPGFGAA